MRFRRKSVKGPPEQPLAGTLDEGFRLDGPVFDAAVEVGVAAFPEGKSPPADEAVLASLEQAGVEYWLAYRLLVFLPLAFGRRLLPGARLSDRVIDGDKEYRLDDDPVFGWASQRAARAVRHEVGRIGLRSSEVNAANQLLRAGDQMEDIQFTTVAMTAPLPPVPAGDGGVPSPRRLLDALLAGHGFTVPGGRIGTTQVDAQLVTLPRPTADTVMAQVDFVVQHPDLSSPRLVESFAAAAPTWRQAIGECAYKFGESVLHTLIAGLLDRTACAGQVSWEPYHHRGGDFDLCTGPLLQQFSNADGPDLSGALDRMLGALEQTALGRKIHWLRIFTCYDHHRLTENEVLLDGQPWRPGESIVAQLTPPATSDLISARLFALLIPGSPARPRLSLPALGASPVRGPTCRRSAGGRLSRIYRQRTLKSVKVPDDTPLANPAGA